MEVVSEDISNVKGIMFENMGLKTELLVGVRSKKFFIPTAIQEEVIPSILAGHSIIARAKNGTGKTASFLIPIIEKTDHSQNKIQSLIIVPTRELAIQTCTICTELSQFTKVKTYAIIGGVDIKDDINNIKKGVQILVITPGRLKEILQHKHIDLSTVKIICIDEADVIVQPEKNYIIDRLLSVTIHSPQFLLFSATFPRSIEIFCNQYLKNALTISTMKEFTLKGITQFYAIAEEMQKVSCLFTLLSKLKIEQCIIFCNSVNRCQLLTEKLNEITVRTKCIHSKMPQKDRTHVFQQFNDGIFKILICSDVFNRGIDIQSVNVVINFDFPSKSATYLHRIGRSGRYGHKGLGISLITKFDREHFETVSKELKTKIIPVPSGVQIDENLYVRENSA